MQKNYLLEELEKINGEKISIDKERLIRIAAESEDMRQVILLLYPELKMPEIKVKKKSDFLKTFFQNNENRINALFEQVFSYNFQVRSGGKYAYKGFYVSDVSKWKIIEEEGGGGTILYNG